MKVNGNINTSRHLGSFLKLECWMLELPGLIIVTAVFSIESEWTGESYPVPLSSRLGSLGEWYGL